MDNFHMDLHSTLLWDSLTAWVSVSPALSQSSFTISSHLSRAINEQSDLEICSSAHYHVDEATYMKNYSLAISLRARNTSSFFQLPSAIHYLFHPLSGRYILNIYIRDSIVFYIYRSSKFRLRYCSQNNRVVYIG